MRRIVEGVEQQLDHAWLELGHVAGGDKDDGLASGGQSGRETQERPAKRRRIADDANILVDRLALRAAR